MQTHTVRFRWFPAVFAFAILLAGRTPVHAQQRPLLTEDPRLVPSGAVDVETGLGYDKRAVYTISNLQGEHVALLPTGLNFGLGDRAEFQISGTLHDYLRTSNGVWHRDFGDISLSTKMKILSESRKAPIISFRPTVVLPNANQGSGLGLNTTRFFASILVGKTVGKAFVFGNVGSGIMDNPLHAGVQNDVFTFGMAGIVPIASHVSWVGEFTGMQNPIKVPAPGSETRRQLRSGFQIEAAGVRWDAGVVAGLTRLDPRWGVSFGLTKRFKKH